MSRSLAARELRVMSSRFAKLLKKSFNLPTTATQAELRKAYYKKAKLLHPDIAGPGSEADFKKLQEDYDEARRLMESGGYEDRSRAGAEQAQEDWPGGGAWQRPREAHWRPNAKYEYREESVNFDPKAFRKGQKSHTWGSKQGSSYAYTSSGTGSSWHKQQDARKPSRLSPAQQFRNLVFVSSGVFTGLFLFSRLGQNARNIQAKGLPLVNA